MKKIVMNQSNRQRMIDLFKSSFIDADDTRTRNSKGSIVYTTSNNPLLDLFSLNGRFDYKNKNDNRTFRPVLVDRFTAAMNFNRLETLAMTLFTVDIKNGLGERSAALTFLQELDIKNPAYVIKLMPLIVKLNGYRLFFIDYKKWSFDVRKAIVKMVYDDYTTNDQSSLLYKWLPSLTTSKGSAAKRFISDWNKVYPDKKMNEATYRKYLLNQRKRLNLIESNMSQKTYNKIKIDQLPNRARRLHLNWLESHLPDEYRKYVQSLETDQRTNHTVSVAEAYNDYLNAKTSEQEKIAEHQFMAAAQKIDLPDGFLPVVDVSGSMDDRLPHSSISNRIAAESLAIAMALKNNGLFHNLIIAFTDDAYVVTAENDRLDDFYRLNQISEVSTNLISVFTRLIDLAKKDPASMPKGVVIFSDGEFDYGDRSQTTFQTIRSMFRDSSRTVTKEMIDDTIAFSDNGSPDYLRHKYDLKNRLEQYLNADDKPAMPKIILWNLNSFSKTIPFQMCEENIYGLSGYNSTVLKTLKLLNDRPVTNMEYLQMVLRPYKRMILNVLPQLRSENVDFAAFKPLKNANDGSKLTFEDYSYDDTDLDSDTDYDTEQLNKFDE